MLYYLFTYLDNAYNFPGAGVFQFITFRAGMAIVTSLLISMVFGKFLINKLRKLQIGETVRDLGLEGQNEKAGTPTMGGLIILGSLIIPVLLYAKLTNIYIIMLLLTTVWMGAIGFIDGPDKPPWLLPSTVILVSMLTAIPINVLMTAPGVMLPLRLE